MVETRSSKKLKLGITSSNNDTTTTTTQYNSTRVGSCSIRKDNTTTPCNPIQVGSSKDRLSELPDEILVRILSFLPTKDAVRTLLLRRFGNLWTLLTTLQFYNSPLNFISNVMKCHKNPIIDKWEFYEDGAFDIEEVSKFLGIALNKKPKVLDICFEYECSSYIKLSTIFTSQSIVTLELTKLLMYLPPRVNMGSLETLKLCCVEMTNDNEDLKVLEAGCPCLQNLSIYFPYGIQNFHFTAPNIERLDLFIEDEDTFYSLDCPNLKILYIEQACLDNLEVIDVSCVTHARINDYTPNTMHHFKTLYKKFQNTKVFHLGNNLLGDKVCMQLEQCGNEKLAFQQNHWSHLTLKPGLLGNCLVGCCRLLRNSQNLEELTLHVNVDFFCDCNMLLQELSSPCEMLYLKTINIRGFEKPNNTIVQLINFLLKSAVVLDSLVIHCNKLDTIISIEGFKFVLQLLSLSRASKNARVLVALEPEN